MLTRAGTDDILEHQRLSPLEVDEKPRSPIKANNVLTQFTSLFDLPFLVVVFIYTASSL